MDNLEGHPIPQDITGFQFRLIGDMTVKQFAYLAAGLVLGGIFFSLPISFLIKLPLAAIFALTGAFLAFAPINGRPADTMIGLFFKAVLKPNQYMYKTQQPTQASPPQPVPVAPIAQPVVIPTRRSEPQTVFFESLPQQPVDQPAPEQAHTSHAYVTVEEEKSDAEKAQEQQVIEAQAKPTEPSAEELVKELEQAKQQEEQQAIGSPTYQQAHQKVMSLEEQMHHVLGEKETLEKRLLELEQQLAKKQEKIFTPTAGAQEETHNVKTIPDTMKKSVGVPLVPDVPNLITGVVKDARGNVLPNMLVEVKDKNDNPVRAFKTNPLGQFASATPLLNGTYTVTFEDPKKQHNFDAIALEVSGKILQPIEITSIDKREELRKSLFS